MQVIGHQALGVDKRVKTLGGIFKRVEEQLIIILSPKDRFSLIAAGDHMIKGACVFNA